MADWSPDDVIFEFRATNHEGLRLTWYFDLYEQAKRAQEFAFERAPNGPTTAITEIKGAEVPADEMICDAGEFARWFTGDDEDDRLAAERY